MSSANCSFCLGLNVLSEILNNNADDDDSDSPDDKWFNNKLTPLNVNV